MRLKNIYMNNLKMLILGGTQMVGRDFVELCLANDVKPILANRGITNNTIFSELQHVKIDRNYKDHCESLKNLEFDLVVDFSCYNINQLTNVIENIKYNKYIIISTLTVFDNEALSNSKHWLHNYAIEKKKIEEYIENNKLDNFLIMRPCALYGRYDYTNRFYEKNNIIYWKHNNSIVKEDTYHIHVRKFSHYLYEYIYNKKTTNIEKSINVTLKEINNI